MAATQSRKLEIPMVGVDWLEIPNKNLTYLRSEGKSEGIPKEITIAMPKFIKGAVDPRVATWKISTHGRRRLE